jgi:hypothetical protein
VSAATKKGIPPIRVGSRRITFTSETGQLVYRCRLAALRLRGEAVDSIPGHAPPHGVRADIELPDGTMLLDVPYQTGPFYWTRPHITSMTLRWR